MKVTLITHGTRGDVQPMLAVGEELRRRGHVVTLGVPPNLTAIAEAAGFAAVATGPDSAALLRSEEGQRWLAAGDVKAFMTELAAMSHANWDDSTGAAEKACADADVILSGMMMEDIAVPIAEARGIPVALLHSAPIRRTRTHASPLVTTRDLPGLLNLATGALFDQVWWRGMRDDVNAFRASLGLVHHRRPLASVAAAAGVLELQAYSPTLVPGLVDYGPRRPLVGFPSPPPSQRHALGDRDADGHAIDPTLDAWLGDGQPPVYIGFGSMPITDPAAAVAMAARVTARLGLRALVSAGWSDLAANSTESDDRVRVVGGVDHSQVLPRCRLAVHHGGAGTTASVAAAGIPHMVCSVFADQPFWGAQMSRLGVGVHERFVDLDEASLEAGLRRLLDPGVMARARRIGLTLGEERDAAVTIADHVEHESTHELRW